MHPRPHFCTSAFGLKLVQVRKLELGLGGCGLSSDGAEQIATELPETLKEPPGHASRNEVKCRSDKTGAESKAASIANVGVADT